MPCRSGSPQEVRIGPPGAAAAADAAFAGGCWAASATPSHPPTTATRNADPTSNRLLMRPSRCSGLLDRLLPKMTIEKFFGKFHTFEFQELRLLFQAPVERHAHLPGPGEDFRVLDRGLVEQHVRAPRRVALDDVEIFAVEVAGPVEPGLIVEGPDVDDERVAVPPADR